MTFDATNPVVALCADGMAIEGDRAAARALFEQAWSIRRDDYDACVAAHFLARHQPTPELTLYWNALAVQHAESVQDGRADGLFASLYLNLGDAHRVAAVDHARGPRIREEPRRPQDAAQSRKEQKGAWRGNHRDRRPHA